MVALGLTGPSLPGKQEEVLMSAAAGGPQVASLREQDMKWSHEPVLLAFPEA